MQTFWKWFLGIVLGLIVIAALVAGPLLVEQYRWSRLEKLGLDTLPAGAGQIIVASNGEAQVLEGEAFATTDGQQFIIQPGRGGRGMMRGFDGGYGMMRGTNGYGGGMMGGGFFHFGWIIPLLLAGGLAYGFYRWGVHNGKKIAAPVVLEQVVTKSKK